MGSEQVLGTTFPELLPLFQEDDETDGVVYYGEIGGVMEEEAEALIESKDVETRVSLISKESFALSEIKKGLARLEADLVRLNTRKEEEQQVLSKRIRGFEEELKATGFGPSKKLMLEELSKTIKELAGKSKRLEVMRKELADMGDAKTRLREYAIQRDTLSSEADEIEKRLGPLLEKDAKYDSAMSAHGSLTERIGDLKVERGKLGQEMTDVRKRMAELDGVKEDVARLERAGAHGFLVGESLMREPDPGKALEALRRPL